MCSLLTAGLQPAFVAEQEKDGLQTELRDELTLGNPVRVGCGTSSHHDRSSLLRWSCWKGKEANRIVKSQAVAVSRPLSQKD